LRFLGEGCKLKIQDIFFDFVDLERTTARQIAGAILKSLKDHNIDIKKARGQAYDSASSERVGVQAWDRETRVKSQGIVKCQKSMEYIVAFLVAKNVLETVKPLGSKLQKRNQDVYKAFGMIESVKSDIKEMWKTSRRSLKNGSC